MLLSRLLIHKNIWMIKMLFWRKLLKDELKKKFCLFNNKHKKIVIKIIKKTIKKNNRLIIQDVSKLKIIIFMINYPSCCFASFLLRFFNLSFIAWSVQNINYSVNHLNASRHLRHSDNQAHLSDLWITEKKLWERMKYTHTIYWN